MLAKFRDAGKLILGICNGFQILLKTQLLVPRDAAGPQATLAANASGKFEDRWVRLGVKGDKCVFLSGIEELELPVAHGEGRFVPRDQLCSIRCGRMGNWYSSMPRGTQRNRKRWNIPTTPTARVDDVAGICDTTGRVFGLMPHPERFVDPTQHPTWTRGPKREGGEGLRVFQNAVRYFS